MLTRDIIFISFGKFEKRINSNLDSFSKESLKQFKNSEIFKNKYDITKGILEFFMKDPRNI